MKRLVSPLLFARETDARLDQEAAVGMLVALEFNLPQAIARDADFVGQSHEMVHTPFGFFLM